MEYWNYINSCILSTVRYEWKHVYSIKIFIFDISLSNSSKLTERKKTNCYGENKKFEKFISPESVRKIPKFPNGISTSSKQLSVRLVNIYPYTNIKNMLPQRQSKKLVLLFFRAATATTVARFASDLLLQYLYHIIIITRNIIIRNISSITSLFVAHD